MTVCELGMLRCTPDWLAHLALVTLVLGYVVPIIYFAWRNRK